MNNQKSPVTFVRTLIQTDQLSNTTFGLKQAQESEAQLVRAAPNNEAFTDWLTKQADARTGSVHTECLLSRYITRHPATLELLNQVSILANYNYPILIQGESGTGKEILARALHGLRSCKDSPTSRFIAVNCTALPGELVESELFGYVKGAFTGANTNKMGKFALANMGTLFLDEIGDMPEHTQAKLLRVLEDGTFTPLGSEVVEKTSARIVCATNVKLQNLVNLKHFRQDLFHRISTFIIKTIPLRDRPCDIIPIAESYLGKAETAKMDFSKVMDYKFPGNVRELKAMLDCYRVFNRFEIKPEEND